MIKLKGFQCVPVILEHEYVLHTDICTVEPSQYSPFDSFRIFSTKPRRCLFLALEK